MPMDYRLKFYSAFDLIEGGDTSTLNIKELSGRDAYRLRIGQYRAIFTNENELIVIDVGSRGDIYK